MADVTLTLRDTPTGGVVVHTTFQPALGQRLTPAQALALDLATQASHRAEVTHMQVVNTADDTEQARQVFDPHTLSLPLEVTQ